MNQIFYVEELVRQIAFNADDGSQGSASLLALACCCKTIEGPVMDVLWRRQKYLHIILRTLSEDCWTITDEGYFITQTPTTDEWERFRRYAALVVDLRIGEWDAVSQANISPETMAFLDMMSTPVPLWPRLTSLGLVVKIGWDVVRSTLAFLSPNIKDLTLGLPQDNSILLQPILSNISDRCHGVQKLVLDIVTGDPRSTYVVGGLISAYRHSLRNLVIKSPLKAEYLHVVANLPQLRTLELEQAHFTDEIPLNSLPSLEAVRLSQFHGTRLPQFFEHLHNPSLKVVDVSSIQVIDFEDLMAALARFSTSLRILYTSAVAHLNLPSVVVPGLFTNLRYLNVRCWSSRRHRCLFRLTDQAVEALGAAMPNIFDLTLGSTSCGGLHAVTFKSLFGLSATCQYLESLAVQVDLLAVVQCCLVQDETVETGAVFGGTQGNPCGLKRLSVGRSALPDYPDSGLIVAVGLGKIFPCLSEIIGNLGWKEVERYIILSRRALCAVQIVGRQ